MAGESSEDTAEDQAEALADELIRDIIKESGDYSDSPVRGMAATTALFETAFGSGRGTSRLSALERLLMADAFASELADAMAPALADKFAPRPFKALEQVMADQAAAKEAGVNGEFGQPGEEASSEVTVEARPALGPVAE
jgi:hypothetical protein